MARPPKGKPLSLRPIRLDDDVWAECQRLGKVHGTINEGVAAAHAALRMQEAQGRVMAETGDPWKAVSVNTFAARGEYGPTRHPAQSMPPEALEAARDVLVEGLRKARAFKPPQRRR